MSTFILKIIAMITMFCDHISYVIFGLESTTFLNCIGRFAMLIFCFQIVLGYKKTKNLKQYLLRILLIAIVSQIPYNLLFRSIGFGKRLNVDFTLFLGLLSLAILNMHKTKKGKLSFRDNGKIVDFSSFKSVLMLVLKLFLIFIICFGIVNIKTVYGYCMEYSYKAIILMIAMYLFYPFDKKQDITKTVLYVLSIIIFGFVEAQMWFGKYDFILPNFYGNNDLISYISIYVFSIIGGLIPLLYNGKKGKSIKWITYLFYPVHIFIIYIIYLIIHA